MKTFLDFSNGIKMSIRSKRIYILIFVWSITMELIDRIQRQNVIILFEEIKGVFHLRSATDGGIAAAALSGKGVFYRQFYLMKRLH